MPRIVIEGRGLLVGLLAVLVWLSPHGASGGVIYVSKFGNDALSGTSWGTARATIRAAVQGAVAGDEVWVAQGEYSGSVPITVPLALYGGFRGNETSLDQRDWGAIDSVALDAIGSEAFQGYVIVNGMYAARGIYLTNSHQRVQDCDIPLGLSMSAGDEMIAINNHVGDHLWVTSTKGIAQFHLVDNELELAEDRCALSGPFQRIGLGNNSAVNGRPHVLEFRAASLTGDLRLTPENGISYRAVNLTIGAGVTLRLAAGAVIRCPTENSFDWGIRVQGTVISEATETEPVVVTHYDDLDPTSASEQTPLRCRAFLFESAAPGQLEGFTVRHAAYGVRGNIGSVANCAFQFCGFSVYGDQATAPVQVSSCLFDGCTFGADQFPRGLTVDDCDVRGDGTGYGFRASPNATPTAVPVSISNCRFSGDQRKRAALVGGIVDGLTLSGNQGTDGIAEITLNPDLMGVSRWADGSTVAYRSTGGIFSRAGSVVTLGEGTTIRFATTAVMQLFGALQSEGTAARPVVLTHLNDTDPFGNTNQVAERWGSVELRGPAATLAGLRVRYAHMGIRYNVTQVTDSAFQFCDYGVYCDGATAGTLLTSCLFDGCTYGADEFPRGLTVDNCEVRGDGTGYGFRVSPNATPTAVPVSITNCRFSGDQRKRAALVGGIVDGLTLSGNQCSDGIAEITLNPDLKGTSRWADGPSMAYRSTGSIVSRAGSTLALGEGTTIRFGTGVVMQLFGALQSEGTAAHPVVLTHLNDTDPLGNTNQVAERWVGVELRGPAATLAGLRVRYAHMGIRYNVTRVTDSAFQFCDYGVYCDGATAGTLLTSCLFDGCTYGADEFPRGLTVDNCEVRGDGTGYGFRVSPNATPTAVPVSITNCRFSGDQRKRAALVGGIVDGLTLSGNQCSDGIAEITLNPDLKGTSRWADGPSMAYRSTGSIVSRAGSTLALGEGTTIRFGTGVVMQLFGALQSEGTAAHPVVLTHLNDTDPFGNTNQVAERWVGVELRGPAATLAGLRVRYAQAGLRYNLAQVSDCTFQFCSFDVYSTSGGGVVRNCWLSGSSYGVYNETGTPVDARYCFWGHASGPYHSTLNPSGQGCRVSNYVLFEPWLGAIGVASLSVTPSTVPGGTTATGTVTLAAPASSGGTAVALTSSDPLVALPPLTITVANGATTASFPIETFMVAAQRSVTIQAATMGTAQSAGLTVTRRLAVVSVPDRAGLQTHTLDLLADLRAQAGGANLAAKRVTFAMDGTTLGDATTDEQGRATLPHTITSGPGDHEIRCDFAGDSEYEPAHGVGTLVVGKLPTELVMADAMGRRGSSVALTAVLTSNGAPLQGLSVAFAVAGTTAGASQAGASGSATIAFAIPAAWSPSTYPTTATCTGNAAYVGSTDSATLEVRLPASRLDVVSRTVVIGDPLNLKAYLWAGSGSPALPGRTVTFKIDGAVKGTTSSDATGCAQITIALEDGPASRTISAEFVGDDQYDGCTGSAPLTALSYDTELYLPARSGEMLETILLKAYLYRADNASPVVSKAVAFRVDGAHVGGATTNSLGRAMLSYTLPTSLGVGVHSLYAAWAGNGGYRPSTATSTLTVDRAVTYLWLASRSIAAGGKAYLRAYLRSLPDYAWVPGKTVSYTLDGVALGSAVTDTGGQASLLYTAPAGMLVGDHPMSARFAGDATYLPGGSNATLKVTP